MLALLGTVFVASLLGSLHCVGMCGPFALLAGSDPERRVAATIPTMAYSFGRLLTYSLVGLIFGSIGLALNTMIGNVEVVSGWQQAATYVAGGLMIVIGLIALARICGLTIKLPQAAAPLQRLLQKQFRRTLQLSPIKRALTIGMLTSLMPCGWLYTFAITAAGTGSPWWGMLTMVVFWAGTVPIMAALMLGINKIGRSVQSKIPFAMASLVIIVGIFTITHRAPVALGSDTQVVNGTQQLEEQLTSVDQSELPCCQE